MFQTIVLIHGMWMTPLSWEQLGRPLQKGVDTVLVVRRTGQDVAWTDGRDLWWHDVVDRQSESHEAKPFDAEHPLFILYTSGSTGKPKGVEVFQRALTNLLTCLRREPGLTPDDVLLSTYWARLDPAVARRITIVTGPAAPQSGKTRTACAGAASDDSHALLALHLIAVIAATGASRAVAVRFGRTTTRGCDYGRAISCRYHSV